MKIGPPPKVTFFHPCPYFQPLTQSLSLGLHLLLGPSRKPPGDFLSNFTGHLNIPPVGVLVQVEPRSLPCSTQKLIGQETWQSPGKRGNFSFLRILNLTVGGIHSPVQLGLWPMPAVPILLPVASIHQAAGDKTTEDRAGLLRLQPKPLRRRVFPGFL